MELLHFLISSCRPCKFINLVLSMSVFEDKSLQVLHDRALISYTPPSSSTVTIYLRDDSVTTHVGGSATNLDILDDTIIFVDGDVFVESAPGGGWEEWLTIQAPM